MQVVDGFDVSFCHHIPSIRAAFGDSDGRGGSIGDLLDRFFNFFAFEFNWENHVVVRSRHVQTIVLLHLIVPRYSEL